MASHIRSVRSRRQAWPGSSASEAGSRSAGPGWRSRSSSSSCLRCRGSDRSRTKSPSMAESGDPLPALAARLQPLADLVPILEGPDADFGHWDDMPTVAGTEHLPWFVFGPTADAFRAAVAHGGWMIVGLDWMSWLKTGEGQALRDDPDAVGHATADQLAMLLTTIIRSDRFVEGSMAGAFESGLLSRIARRAATLLAETAYPDLPSAGRLELGPGPGRHPRARRPRGGPCRRPSPRTSRHRPGSAAPRRSSPRSAASGDPDRAADDDRSRAELDRPAQLAEDPLGRGDRLVASRDPAEEDRELVAALAADDVLGPDGADQPLRDLDEDLVAGRVAVRVVDPLEVVEVDEEQGDRPVGSDPAAPAPARGGRAGAPGWPARSADRAAHRG